MSALGAVVLGFFFLGQDGEGEDGEVVVEAAAGEAQDVFGYAVDQFLHVQVEALEDGTVEAVVAVLLAVAVVGLGRAVGVLDQDVAGFEGDHLGAEAAGEGRAADEADGHALVATFADRAGVGEVDDDAGVVAGTDAGRRAPRGPQG